MTTTRNLIKGAMRLINVTAANEEPSQDDMEIALSSLNGLVDSLGNDILNIYTVQPYYFPLTPGKQHYTLGPALDSAGNLTGADWVITRPMRIEQAKLLLYPQISYPSEPVVEGCNLVSSQEDANVFELWHFDEGLGATETTAAVWVYEDAAESTITMGTTWSLQNGCCDTGLFLGNEDTLTGATLSPNAGGGFIGPTLSLPDGYTIEFSLFNNGSTSPGLYDYIEVFRHDAVTYDGEGVVIIRGFKVGQDLYIVYGSDMDTGTMVVIPLAVDTCTAICIEGATGGSLSIYANGTRVLNIPMDNNDFWNTYGIVENAGGFTVLSNVGAFASQLIIDEYRRSNIVRYDAATYEYQI